MKCFSYSDKAVIDFSQVAMMILDDDRDVNITFKNNSEVCVLSEGEGLFTAYKKWALENHDTDILKKKS